MVELSVTTLAFAGEEGLVRGRPHACICVSHCTRDGPSHMPLPRAPEQALSTRHNIPADGQCSSTYSRLYIISTLSQSSCITYTSPPRREPSPSSCSSTQSNLPSALVFDGAIPTPVDINGEYFLFASFCSLYFLTKSSPAAL